MFPTIGFIGCGNMGSAMARAVRMAGPEVELFFANRSPAKAQELADRLVGQVTDNGWIAANCSLIVLGVKPQMMGQMLAGLKEGLAGRKDRFVLLTMAAGLTMQTIRELAGGEWPVARIMPNIPCAIGAGIIQMCHTGLTEQERNELKLLLSGAGLVDELDESLIDAACAVSGCGPAFAYLFMDALAQGGERCGLSREKALLYAARMLEGAARLARESGQTPRQLVDAVCSPGGATIQGVHVLKQRDLRGVTVDAVQATYRRTLELK